MRNWRLLPALTSLQPALPKLTAVPGFPAANTYPCSRSPCSWCLDVAGSPWEPGWLPCPSPAHWGSQQNWWNCTSEKQIEENTQVIPVKQCWVPYNEWIQQNLQEKLLSQTSTGCPEGKVRFIQHQLDFLLERKNKKGQMGIEITAFIFLILTSKDCLRQISYDIDI